MEDKKEIIVDGKKVLIPEGQVSGVEEKESKEMSLWFQILFLAIFAAGFFTVSSESTVVVLSQFALLFACFIYGRIKWGLDSSASSDDDDDDSWSPNHSSLDVDSRESSFDSGFSSLSSDDSWPSSSWGDWHHDVVKDPAYAGSLNIWD